MGRPLVVEDPAEHRHDLACIRGIFRDLQRGFNTGDPELLGRHLAGDSVAVNVFGAAVEGVERLEAAQRAGLTRLFSGAEASYEPVDVRFVRPDVAVVRVDVRPAPLMPPTCTGLWVLVRHDGRWWVAATQSTVRVG